MDSKIGEVQKRDYTLLRNVIIVFFISGTSSQPLGSFLPFLRESYGFSYDFSGVLLSCQSIGSFLAVLAMGFLPIRFGRRRSIMMVGIWMPIAFLILSSGIGSPIVIMAAFLMTGIARGGATNFSNTMISTLPEPLSAKGYNIAHGGFAVGALLSPLALILCVWFWPMTGWRVMSAILLLLGICQFGVYTKMEIPNENFSREKKKIDMRFFKVKQFWLGASMLFFYISTEYAIVGWLVTYFQDTGLLSDNFSQIMNSFIWLIIFIGRMVGVGLTGKIARHIILMANGVGLCAFFTLLLMSRSSEMIMLCIAGVGFFMATIYPTAFSYGSECVKGNDLGCSILVFAGSIGGIIAPAAVGAVAEKSGISAGMALVAGFTFMLLISIIISAASMKKSVAV